jgi:hypothetical protein
MAGETATMRRNHMSNTIARDWESVARGNSADWDTVARGNSADWDTVTRGNAADLDA